MKTAVFTQFGEPKEVLSIQEHEKPAVSAGEVRVRMVASPINPSDLLTVRGSYGRLPALPATPGFEGVGVIEEVGAGWVAWLRRLKPGMRVAVLNPKGGNWAEFVTLSAQHVVPVGDLPDAQAASFFVNPATAVAMTRHELRIRRGEWLLQTAAGSALGGMVRSLGEHNGFRVINIVRRAEQADEMKKNGHVAFATQRDDVEKEVRQLTSDKGVPYAIDAVGGETAMLAANCLAQNGRLLVYGVLANEPIHLDPRALIVRQARVEGFWLSEWVKRQNIPSMLSLFRNLIKLMKTEVIKTDAQEFPLHDIQAAVAEAERPGRTKKVLLRI